MKTQKTHLFQVDVGEDELVVGRVDDGGAVGAGENVRVGARLELSQDRRLGSERDPLAVPHLPRLRVEDVVKDGPVSECAEEVVRALEARHQDAARDRLAL